MPSIDLPVDPSPVTTAPALARRALLAAAALACAALLSGCSSGSAGEAVKMYEAGNYAEALREAETVHEKTRNGSTSEQAALVAGLSSYELGRYDDAEKWLRPLTRSTDRNISGRALAATGLIGVRRDRFSTAAIDLTAAGRRLQGNDAAQANFYAGECHALLGNLHRARSAYVSALRSADDPELRQKIASRQSGGEYSLQFGAFSNKANADQALAAAARRASAAGLDAPRLVSTPDVSGRTIHLVQLGRFKTRNEAITARSKLGGEAAVVQAR
jgi:tetratricopeptide (TPR) repeat protein